ncbi:hypothetical protein STAL104432_23090 [Streptomyces albus]
MSLTPSPWVAAHRVAGLSGSPPPVITKRTLPEVRTYSAWPSGLFSGLRHAVGSMPKAVM